MKVDYYYYYYYYYNYTFPSSCCCYYSYYYYYNIYHCEHILIPLLSTFQPSPVQVAIIIPSLNDHPLSPHITQEADEVVILSLNFATARKQVADHQLDILVFGEMNSEPLNHFLGE